MVRLGRSISFSRPVLPPPLNQIGTASCWLLCLIFLSLVGLGRQVYSLLLELHKKDGSGEKSYPQAFAYRMVEGGRGSNTFRLMLDHCIRDISNELSDL